MYKPHLFAQNFCIKSRCGLSVRTSVHHAVNLHKLTPLKELLAFLEQVNVTQQGISILPQSCLQYRRWLLASTEIDPPWARKYHAILEYSRGKWLTISSLFNSVTANLLNWLSNSLWRAYMSENKCTFALRKRRCVLNCTKKSTCFHYSISWSYARLLSYERTKTFFRCCCM